MALNHILTADAPNVGKSRKLGTLKILPDLFLFSMVEIILGKSPVEEVCHRSIRFASKSAFASARGGVKEPIKTDIKILITESLL